MRHGRRRGDGLVWVWVRMWVSMCVGALPARFWSTSSMLRLSDLDLYLERTTISHIIMVWDIFDGFTRNGMTGGQRVVSAEH